MIKHTETIRRLLLTNCLSVFDHFVGMVLTAASKHTSCNLKKNINTVWRISWDMKGFFVSLKILYLTKNLLLSFWKKKEWNELFTLAQRARITCSKLTIETRRDKAWREICSKLAMKTPEWHFVLVFLLTLSR